MVRDVPSVRIQVVLFEQHRSDVERLVPAVAATARVATASAGAADVHLALGDCSPRPVLDDAAVAVLREEAVTGGLAGMSYEFFDANLGSSGGSNRLALGVAAGFVLVLNPDTYPAPSLLTEMLRPFADPAVGAADARQLPLEHPKEYDAVTGDTSWVSGSCMLVRGDVFAALGGFDADHFPLYCDDVDLSWRIRSKGFRTVHVPAAVVFHDKRIDPSGHIVASPLEWYHATLGRLMLATKYGRPDLVAATVAAVEASGSADERAALAEWRRRVEAGTVPDVVPGAESVAQFVDGQYARHRF